MRFAICCAAFAVLCGTALAAASDMPSVGHGKAGRFPLGLSVPSGRVVSGTAAGRALAGLAGETQTLRGGADAALYRRLAPSVVLVITDKGFGSGSLITRDGEVITSFHVVKGFDTVGVLLKPDKEGEKLEPSKVLTADVVKYDGVADLALLKIRSLPSTVKFVPVVLGDFDKVKVGDDVVAIGHPEGEAWTFTKGYVSQVRRDYGWAAEGSSFDADVIQTQTPINPGNSGGPLLDSAGELIGINAFGNTEGQGLNYAVGVDMVKAFLKAAGNRAPVGGAAGATAQEASACKPQLLFDGRNDQNNAAIRAFDTACKGQVTLVFMMPDDAKKPLMALYYPDGDNHLRGVVLSLKRDGYWNISYWDTKGDDSWDTIGYHPDGKLTPTSYGPNQSGWKP